ncbi:hypothetical protein [Amycolatopsis sp. H20-H5]|uniref:hypothetical protein n=1 Tax=Amycolatopsis sp. H20-H5 TaxID=3046309 RepID=UPI002DBD9BEE|nr:hypothetical protein [Amycolatopsis sp. H20-H5]MEC3977067.1 hypothetical protein [Amycolatopsis sp. H20-H5]
MDERELESLFADLPGEPPAATFGKGDVLTASKRATQRSRNRVILACSAFVLVLGGVGVATAISGTSGGDLSTAAAPAGAPFSVQGEQPGTGAGRPQDTGFPATPPQQGGDETGKTGPRAEGASGCEKGDRELATALAGELPVPVSTAVTVPGPGRACSTGARTAGFPVPGGTMDITLFKPGASVPFKPPPRGTASSSSATPNGGMLQIQSTPDPGSATAPFAEKLAPIAQALAPRF